MMRSGGRDDNGDLAKRVADILTNDDYFLTKVAERMNFKVIRRILLGAIATLGLFGLISTYEGKLAGDGRRDNDTTAVGSYSAIIYEREGVIRAEDPFGELIYEANSSNPYMVGKIVEKVVNDIGGRICFKGKIPIGKTVNIRRNDVFLDLTNAEIVAKEGCDIVFLLGTESRRVYRVHIFGGVIDCNDTARGGIIGYNSAKGGCVDGSICFVTVKGARGSGIGGCMYNYLLLHNVCNFNTVGIHIANGQHVTLIDNATFKNRAPGVVAVNSDTAFIIRHKSLGDNTQNNFWKAAIVLGGYKMKTLTDSEIRFFNFNSACNYGVLVESAGDLDEFTAIIDNVIIRNESEHKRQQAVRVNLMRDDHICYLGKLDIRGQFVYDVQHASSAGITEILLPSCPYTLSGLKHIDRSIEGVKTVYGDGVTMEFTIVDNLDDIVPTTDVSAELSATKYGVVPVVKDIDGDGKAELVGRFITPPNVGEVVNVYYRIRSIRLTKSSPPKY